MYPKLKIHFIWVHARYHFCAVNIKIDSYYQEKSIVVLIIYILTPFIYKL
nr:MAG TPA: hypothetical protein [Caudoviricetes sp.]